MDIAAFIISGIIEKYCSGNCTTEEAAMVEKMAVRYPEVKREVETIRQLLENYLLINQVKPSSSVKSVVMKSVYQNHAADNPAFPPLINKDMHPRQLDAWVKTVSITAPSEEYENLHIIGLPSTNEVTNFFVFAKLGHEEEMHSGFIEYLYVAEGACSMYFKDIRKDYRKGDIIAIEPEIPHRAVVTSAQPMFALVQRQQFI